MRRSKIAVMLTHPHNIRVAEDKRAAGGRCITQLAKEYEFGIDPKFIEHSWRVQKFFFNLLVAARLENPALWELKTSLRQKPIRRRNSNCYACRMEHPMA